jgi:hypothetical protein
MLPVKPVLKTHPADDRTSVKATPELSPSPAATDLDEPIGKREKVLQLLQKKYSTMLNMIELMTSLALYCSKEPEQSKKFEDLKSLVTHARSEIKTFIA